MQHVCTFEADTARALLLHAADKNERIHLRGVYIDTAAAAAVSTDGATLLAVPVEIMNEVPSFIIPSAALKLAVRNTSKHSPDIEVWAASDPNERVELRAANGITPTAALGLQFPTWQHVVPKKITTQPAEFNPDLLARVQQSLNLINGFKGVLRILPNGHGPAVAASESALALIMPIKPEVEGVEPIVRRTKALYSALKLDAPEVQPA